jgi:cell division protein FtsW
MSRRFRQAVAVQQVPFTDVLRNLDPWLLGSLVLLVSIGLIVMTSASVSVADQLRHDPFYYLFRQIFAFALGFGIGVAVLSQPTERWYQASGYLLFAALICLMMVLIPGLGHGSHGSMRWLKLGPLAFQPSEPAKLCVILYLAGYLVRHSEDVKHKLVGLVKPVLVVMAFGVLLLLEPDFGVTTVLVATTLGLVFLAGVSVLRFLAWSSAGVIVMGILLAMAPYRLKRLIAFWDPWHAPLDEGFQLTQALIAFGRGEWFGVGLGGSVQKLHYLPEAHTDFVLSVLAEEFGFAGTLVVIVLYGYVLWQAFAIAARAQRLNRLFDAYIAYGVGLLIALQAYINAGVNMGLLPTKGLTLPLMSYGCNSVIVSCLCFALLLRVAYQCRDPAPNAAVGSPASD